MRRADDFGKEYNARTQMFYASMSYWFHVDIPEDLTERTKELQDPLQPVPYIEGTHMPASFGHLEGTARATTRTCGRWSSPRTCSAPSTAATCSTRPSPGATATGSSPQGGQKDAADLVADFLGRPYTFDAYAAWLAE